MLKSTGCARCGLEDDYIPDGGTAYYPVNLRSPNPEEFYRCGAQVSCDFQSGPIYCGKRATLIADEKDKPGVTIACCDRHAASLRNLESIRNQEIRRKEKEREAAAELADLWDAH